MQGSLQALALKSVLAKVKTQGALMDVGSQAAFTAKPTFFSLSKAQHALDFNKFFKVNKIAALAINGIGSDLYTQYLANLQDLQGSHALLITQTSKQQVRAARALRKYIKLLRSYFKEVYDNKLSKKIPASSAMHWIREYLRLTSSIKRRTSL